MPIRWAHQLVGTWRLNNSYVLRRLTHQVKHNNYISENEKRKRRLYAQWIEKAQLPPEAVPQGILDYPSLGGKLGRGRRHPY